MQQLDRRAEHRRHARVEAHHQVRPRGIPQQQNLQDLQPQRSTDQVEGAPTGIKLYKFARLGKEPGIFWMFSLILSHLTAELQQLPS